MAGEIIRQGDPTSHGGKVLEGSIFDICHGKPISFVGHKVLCPKCKGIFPIVEGALTTTFYGKGVALAGMKTACGATLIATQFHDTVEYGGGSAGRSGAVHTEVEAGSGAKQNNSPQTAAATNSPKAASTEIEEEHSYALIDESGTAVEEYRYDLHSDDILHAKAARYRDGSTVAVKSENSSMLVCWLARDGAAKS